MAAGVFSNQSHIYPGNYDIYYWRALFELLESTGRKRL